MVRVHREYSAAERAAEKSPKDVASDRVRSLRSADHGDRPWRKNRVKRVPFGAKNVVRPIAGRFSDGFAGRLAARCHGNPPHPNAVHSVAVFRRPDPRPVNTERGTIHLREWFLQNGKKGKSASERGQKWDGRTFSPVVLPVNPVTAKSLVIPSFPSSRFRQTPL